MSKNVMYICPVCFRVCETEEQCHQHQMVECEVGEPGGELRKPVKDRFGLYVSRAPRWFLQAIGRIKED